MKITCPECNQEKDESQFSKCSSHANGRQTYCKKCRRKKYPGKKYYVAHPRSKGESKWTPEQKAERAKDRMLRHRYGITLETYKQMLSAQGGVCAICGKTPEESKAGVLVVDHCHKTGKVRGLLCSGCNVRINILDDMPLLDKAVKYLGV